MGFSASKYDTSLFILDSDEVYIVVLICVDDIITTKSSSFHVNSLITDFHSQFALKDLGILDYFLGPEVIMHTNVLSLNQQKYINDLLLECDMVIIKDYDTPMITNKSLSKEDGIPLVDATLYRNVVGSL